MYTDMKVLVAASFFILLNIKRSSSENTKLKDVLRNNNNFNRTYDNSSEDDVLKSEIKNVLKYCSSSKNRGNQDDDNNSKYNSNSQSTDTYKRINQNYKNFEYENGQQNDSNSNRHSRNNRQNSNYNNYNTRNDGNGDNPNSNGNRNNNNYNSGSYDSNDDPYGSYGSNYNNNGNNNERSHGMVMSTCKCPACGYYQSRFDSYSYNNNNDRNGNTNYGSSSNNGYGSSSRLNNGGSGYNYGYDANQRDGMGKSHSASTENVNVYNREFIRQNNRGRNEDLNDGFYNVGLTSYGRRMKRDNQNNNNNSNKKNTDENQCTSQCVFGQMELLDDEQIPSETLFIKWVQGHIANDDMKRIKTLREVRRCFTRMSTTAIDDGCEYSNELSKCLNLDLD